MANDKNCSACAGHGKHHNHQQKEHHQNQKEHHAKHDQHHGKKHDEAHGKNQSNMGRYMQQDQDKKSDKK